MPTGVYVRQAHLSPRDKSRIRCGLCGEVGHSKRGHETWAAWGELWSTDKIREHLLESQNGLCLFCDEPLDLADAHIDHDHRCHDVPSHSRAPMGRWCPTCVRGVAHKQCNWIAGYAQDNPTRLLNIAFNLYRAREEYEEKAR